MNRKKIILPVLIIAICGVMTVFLVKFGRRAQPVPVDPVVPTVETMEVKLKPKEFRISSQGTVRAATSIPLISELDGLVVEVAPVFQQGGFFSKGDVLLRLDETDYEALVAQAESQLAGARLRLETVEAESKLARQDWEALSARFNEGATPLLLREPQLTESRALVRAAEASLAKAKKDLERTRIRAPFDGRILAKTADLGQFVRRGQELARAFDISKVEIQLPVAVSELAFIDPRLGVPGGGASSDGVHVELMGSYAGLDHHWEGRIRRTAGGVDDRSRMISLVAEVNDPFGVHHGGKATPPLQVGSFVEATIQGIKRNETFTVPRSAILPGDHVVLVDEKDQVQFRKVRVLRFDGDDAIIGSGLKDGEVVCVSAMEFPAKGTKVNPIPVNKEGDQ